MIKNPQTDKTYQDIYNIISDITAETAINGKIESQNGNQQKNNKQSMQSKAMFSEHEKIFKERTGKDFSTLYKKYYPKLVYFTSKICNDTQKAEDISTESFLSAFDKIEKYEKDKSQFSTWLFTIAKNLALQEIKNQKKLTSIDLEYDEEGTTMKDFIPEEEIDLNIHEVFSMKAEIMKKYMSTLKEPYKTVIEMREIKKMAYKDISEQLGKNLSTIKSQIRNARHILISQSKSEFDSIDEMYM